jgi:hypothetical protein
MVRVRARRDATDNSLTVTPPGDTRVVESPSLRFAEAVRALGLEARRHGLQMPAFRSPPRLDGVARSMRRRADGNATIAVVVRNRPWAAVLADMVEGIIVANRLRGADADRARARLWSSVGDGRTVAA